jgi:AcrR family transcriptional regulator
MRVIYLHASADDRMMLMPNRPEAAPKRRRGRPRASESANRREQIVAAAADEFAERGYDGATMRGIASRAGVDPALLHHYFGTKSDLFGATVRAPIRPDLELPKILAGPREEIGASIVRFLLTALDDPVVQKRTVLIIRSAVGNKTTTPLMSGFLQHEVLRKVVDALDVPDAELRASLMGSQIAGLIVARYILKLPGVADAGIDELVDRVGPTLQRYLVN